MLKPRLIPCLILKDDRIVQSIKFKRYLPIGRAEMAIEFFMNWDVDEIVLLDIHASQKGRKPQLDLIKHFSQHCFLPFTVGGGINSVDDMRNVLKAGADKIVINQAAVKTPGLIEEGAHTFGTQCITVSMDVKINTENQYEVFIHSGSESTGLDPIEWAHQVESLGAGEILLNSIDRDGTRQGYDLDLIQRVQDKVKIPVIACGGVGQMQDFVDGIQKAGAHAVAAANIFQHMEHSTIIAKSFMKKAGIDVRLDTQACYENHER